MEQNQISNNAAVNMLAKAVITATVKSGKLTLPIDRKCSIIADIRSAIREALKATDEYWGTKTGSDAICHAVTEAIRFLNDNDTAKAYDDDNKVTTITTVSTISTQSTPSTESTPSTPSTESTPSTPSTQSTYTTTKTTKEENKVTTINVKKEITPEQVEQVKEDAKPIKRTKKWVGAIKHAIFDKVKKIVDKFKFPVYLNGEAGTGKNVICEQLAEELDLDFYMQNKVTDEYQLSGFVDANGNYIETAFFNAFTKGGLFMFDEADAGDPSAFLFVNAAIANGYCTFPGKGKMFAHKDFRVVAAGNTVGLGADEKYTGRYQLDMATLDRYVYLTVDYDERIELLMAGGNKQIVEFVHDLRIACEKANVNTFTISYRGIKYLTELEKEFGTEDAMRMAIIKGMDADNVNNLAKNLVVFGNKYASVFTKCGKEMKKRNNINIAA